jgi:hypothetical protein
MTPRSQLLAELRVLEDAARAHGVDAVTLSVCGAELGLTVRQLRYAVRQGAPVARRGRKGRGGATLVEPAAISAWMQERGDYAAVQARWRIARDFERNLAESLVLLVRNEDGPHKRALARSHVLTFEFTANRRRADLGLPPLERCEWPACIDQIDKSTSI